MSRAVIIFKDEKISYRFLCYGIRFRDKICRVLINHIYKRQEKESNYIHHRDKYIDETVIQIENHAYWLWIFIKSLNSSVFGSTFHFRGKKHMFLAEKLH